MTPKKDDAAKAVPPLPTQGGEYIYNEQTGQHEPVKSE